MLESPPTSYNTGGSYRDTRTNQRPLDIPTSGIGRCDVDLGVMALDMDDPITFEELEF